MHQCTDAPMHQCTMHQWACHQTKAVHQCTNIYRSNATYQCIMPCASTVFDEETAAGQLCELAKRGEIEKVTLLLSG